MSVGIENIADIIDDFNQVRVFLFLVLFLFFLVCVCDLTSDVASESPNECSMDVLVMCRAGIAKGKRAQQACGVSHLRIRIFRPTKKKY